MTNLPWLLQVILRIPYTDTIKTRTINQAVAGFGLYPKAPKEFNLFWLTSLPQSFAPLEYTTLLRLQTNQQLVDLLFTILSILIQSITYHTYMYVGI